MGRDVTFIYHLFIMMSSNKAFKQIGKAESIDIFFCSRAADSVALGCASLAPRLNFSIL